MRPAGTPRTVGSTTPFAKTQVSESPGEPYAVVPPYITTPVGAVAIPGAPRSPGAHMSHTCDHEVPFHTHDAALEAAPVIDRPP